MYGKVFDTIYKGTLYGQWEALVTMQQLIVLADADGVVDMTPMAISGTTSIPREIIDKGLEILAAPDKYTRTPGSDGRRIELIDEHRPWGWVLINYDKYKKIRDSETVREQTRERVRKHRAKKKAESKHDDDVKDVTECNASNSKKRHIDIDIDIRKDIGQKPPVLTARFEEFWKGYPKKRQKKTAKEIWRRKRLDKHADKLIKDVENRIRADKQWKDGFAPNPTTYLNQERWEDELAPEAMSVPIKHRKPEVVTEEQLRRDREKADRELAKLMRKS
jgi:hypothetical protein